MILHPVTFKDRIGYILHKNLRAIDNNTLMSKLAPDQMALPEEVMLTVDSLIKYYEFYPRILQNTERLLSECSVCFDYDRVKNKQTFTGNRYDDKVLLEKLARDGLIYRYGKNNKTATERVRHELEIIDRMGFSSYFLITWDIVRYSMSRGFYHVGRGSGANSVVAYCLKITDVDPIDLDLYFERFINPRRAQPPILTLTIHGMSGARCRTIFSSGTGMSIPRCWEPPPPSKAIPSTASWERYTVFRSGRLTAW